MYIVTGVFWLECAKFRVRFLRCTQGILAPPAGVKTPNSDHTRTPNLLYVDTPVRGVCSVHAHTHTWSWSIRVLIYRFGSTS